MLFTMQFNFHLLPELSAQVRGMMQRSDANHSAGESAGQGGELNKGGAAKGVQRVGRKKPAANVRGAPVYTRVANHAWV